MWIRKSDFEIENLRKQQERQKKSLKRPFIFGSAFGLLFMILTYLGYRGGARGVYILASPSGFNSRTVIAGAFGFAIFFGLTFYHQRKGSSFLAEETYHRCDTCTKLHPVNPAKTCPCGGRLEPADYYGWEE
jgi:hypothetical protein